ncbi:MAG TPA: glycogen/starch synthase [Gemmatimonadales bacterium]|nr:glycogen/starch synthase [Gemmatimonadales bacterium]
MATSVDARGARRRAEPRKRPKAPGVVHLTAEYWPLARTGGLGEAVNGLATYQAGTGTRTAVVMPLYQMVRDKAHALERVGPSFLVTFGSRVEEAWLYRIPSDSGPQVYLIEHPGYFDRAAIYGDGADYPDNARRFAFFSLAAIAALPQIAPDAKVLHAHDWHTALAIVYLRTRYADKPFFRDLATVLSVHNAGFQGHYPPETVADVGLPAELFDWRVFEWYGQMNVLKGGLVFADAAVTVSPTHARELLTAEGGFGLHDVFTGLGERLGGVLNGIDAEKWNPESDPGVPTHFSSTNLTGKRACKRALQHAYGLTEDPDLPLFAMSARLVSQKGLDLVLGGTLLHRPDAQFIFLGAGERRYHDLLAAHADRFPDRVAVEFAFTDRLEHGLLSGADLLLMPSLYEPCGLTQMRAQRYGAIPVARRVGGLQDSIEDGRTGFLFTEYTPEALEAGVERALVVYRDKRAWSAMVKRSMELPFGWGGAAERYQEIYRMALTHRAGAL